METSSPLPPLPLDIVLEILARSDASTIARCGATCKLLRHHVTDPAFLRRLDLGSGDHFLLGLLYHRRFAFPWTETTRFPPLFTSATLSVSVVANVTTEMDGPYDPVASSGGLIVPRREDEASRLCVCDPAAGRRYVLPPKKIPDRLHVIMPEDQGFKLLVADHHLETQTYSSKAGAWGRVTETPAGVPGAYQQVQPSHVVLGGVAHWLYHQRLSPIYSVLALDVATGQAAWIATPQDCHRRRTVTSTVEKPKEVLLVSSPDGKLALLVWERPIAVTMWTMATDDDDDAGSESAGRSWARRVVIKWATIFRSVNPWSNSPLGCQQIAFAWFAEGSGTVVLHMSKVGIVLLNLRTLEVHHLKSRKPHMADYDIENPAFLDDDNGGGPAALATP
ncbi:hypothetical protein QOZ80_2AG0135110 [Eleusine coracana subsp. coracana]|nr:hypothetical protein QOZ80_2AG0135110 [Eleusine coracana subsp. coracana]